jgi:hypothetical protein
MVSFNKIVLVGMLVVLTLLLGGCQTDMGLSAPSPSATVKSSSTPEPSAHPESTSTPLPSEVSNTVQATPRTVEATPKSIQVTPQTSPNLSIDHILVVVEENHSYRQIVGSKDAPYMNQLIQQGALFTNSHAVAHPSQPNYLALFSGSTQGIKDDSCGKTYSTANLASELIQNKLSFVGYSEDLPKSSFTGCSSKGYARKHNPWIQFKNVPIESNQPLSAFPQDFSQLPTVSFVIPNHQDDMHDGTIQQADTWLKDHLEPYVTWAQKNHSLLIVTWDEDDNSKENRIPTIFVGPMVKPGKYDEAINHYHVLRTIEDFYHLSPIGESAKVGPISTIWTKN